MNKYYYKYEEEKSCVICYKKNIFLHSLDCHHRSLCKECLRIVTSKKMNCPICRHKFEYTTMDFIESCVTILNNYSLNSFTHIPLWLFESEKFEERIVKEMNKNKRLYLNIPEKYKCKTSKWWIYVPYKMGKIIPQHKWQSIIFCILAINQDIRYANFIPLENFRIMYSCSYDIHLKKKDFKKKSISLQCYNNLYFCFILLDQNIISKVELLKIVTRIDTILKLSK